MGSGKDLESAGLRRLIINAAYWGLGMETAISPTSSVDYIGAYEPLASGFNYEKARSYPEAPCSLQVNGSGPARKDN